MVSVSSAVVPTPHRAANAWNKPLSWELILGITPHLPRLVLAPLHHATSALCFAAMPRQRAAASRNLQRVTGEAGLRLALRTYRLFHQFSRFMVAYGELKEASPESFRDRLDGAPEAEAVVAEALAKRKGLIVATLHLGQWDLGLKLLAKFERPVHVVMRQEDPAEVTHHAAAARAMPQLRVHQSGEASPLGLELLAALRRGEIVAVQLDRPAGPGSTRPTQLFGALADLPTGPLRLALASGAPLVPVVVLFGRGRKYSIAASPPLCLDGGPRALRDEAAVDAGMQVIAKAMEGIISRNAEQWFNFHDVWPRGLSTPPHETARG